MTNRHRLKALPLLNALPELERQQLVSELEESSYRKGQFIFREGDPAEYFHILLEGAVKCVKSSAHGKDLTLKVLMPGDLFCCEAAVMDGTPHPGCAQPLGDVKVLRLHKKAYFEILRRNPDAALEIIKYLGRRLNEAQEQAKVFAVEKAEPRLASLLLGLAERAGVKEPDGIRLTIRLTRQDLADIAGITVETAIRIIGRLKRAGAVSGTAKRLVIRSLPRLRQFASP